MRELEKIAVYAPDDARGPRHRGGADRPDVEARVHQLADALVDGEPRSPSRWRRISVTEGAER